MKLRTLLKMIPNGQKLRVKYEGSSFKEEEYTKSEYSFSMLEWFNVHSISTNGDTLEIVAVLPRRTRK